MSHKNNKNIPQYGGIYIYFFFCLNQFKLNLKVFDFLKFLEN